MAGITLTLKTASGSFIFSGPEVPEKISIGGDQMLNTHKLVGGVRIVDAMGPDDQSLSWSGWFLYGNATARARFLDNIRRQGLPCTLTWDMFSYQVVISRFTADYEKHYKMPFSITCEVIQDNTQRLTKTANPSPADALKKDSASLNSLNSLLATISKILTIGVMVESAVAAISAVLGSSQPVANGLVTLSTSGGTGTASTASSPISSALAASTNSNVTSALNSAMSVATAALVALETELNTQISASSATVASIPSIGTLDASLAVEEEALLMQAQANAAVELTFLMSMLSIVLRMLANLPLITNPGGNNQIVTGGGNLYQRASQAYSDATRWTDIAQASGLTDPMTPGFNPITIPAA